MTVEAEHAVAHSVAQRIEAIIAAAEGETRELREQVQAEVEHYAVTERARVDAQLGQRQVAAEAEIERYLADTRARIDEFAAQRLSSITTLTDHLIENANQLQERFETAETVRRQVYGLIAAIGEVAERLTEETPAAEPELPRLVIPRAPQDL
jgi:hypothetical protein